MYAVYNAVTLDIDQQGAFISEVRILLYLQNASTLNMHVIIYLRYIFKCLINTAKTVWCIHIQILKYIFLFFRPQGVLAARGLIYSNSSRATSDLCSSYSGCWRPMHKPSWYEVRRQEQENKVTAHCLFWRQQEDLPLLTPLASRFDIPQKNFLRQVIAIPKWRSFKR